MSQDNTINMSRSVRKKKYFLIGPKTSHTNAVLHYKSIRWSTCTGSARNSTSGGRKNLRKEFRSWAMSRRTCRTYTITSLTTPLSLSTCTQTGILSSSSRTLITGPSLRHRSHPGLWVVHPESIGKIECSIMRTTMPRTQKELNMGRWTSPMIHLGWQFAQAMASLTFCLRNTSETDAPWLTWILLVRIRLSALSGSVIICYANFQTMRSRLLLMDQKLSK